MNYILQIVLLSVFGWVLVKSADVIIRATVGLARVFGVASFTLSFLLLGMLTSIPELSVALQSAISGTPILSLGDLIGGSILLLSFVMGTSAFVLGRVRLDHGLTFSEIVFMSFIVALPIFVLWDGALTRVEGVLLIILYILHAAFLNKEEAVSRHLKRHAISLKTAEFDGAKLLLGMVGVVVASKVLVSSAQTLSHALGMPIFVSGLLLLSIGTNLPELALAFEAVKNRRKNVAFGDFLGSAAANTLILGILGLLSPFGVSDRGHLWFSLVLLGCICLFFVWALSSKRDIDRREGIGLLFFYLLFLTFELFSS